MHIGLSNTAHRAAMDMPQGRDDFKGRTRDGSDESVGHGSNESSMLDELMDLDP